MQLFNRFAAGVLVACTVVSCSTESDVTTPSDPSKQDGKIMAAPSWAKKVPDQYVIIFKDANVAATAVPGEVNRLVKKHGLELGYIYETAIRGFSATLPPGILKKLAEDDNIDRIEEDYEITVGPVEELAKPGGGGGGGAYTRTSPEVTPWGVLATGSADGTGKRAWILDTGIDPKHPDLNVDATRSRNFVVGAKQSASTWQDKNGHGTHVAGTIAAKTDGYDVKGVAAGATVISMRCLDARGSGQYSWIIAAVNHVAMNGIAGDVANMSLGGPSYSALDDAIKNAANNAGIIFTLAAGNESKDCSTTSPARAGLNEPFIWTVSSHTNTGAFSWFSNFGDPVDICAPGSSILSTKMGGGTTTMSGTSMAAPHVAGILLVGTVGTRGLVTGDPDGNADDMAMIQ